MSTNSKGKRRSIFSLICCACRTTKERIQVQTQACNTNEPCDYVVEKLAIKKLPLTAFATPEDMAKYNKTSAKNPTHNKQMPLISPESSIASTNRDPPVYMQPSISKGNQPSQAQSVDSHTAVIQHEEAFYKQYPAKTVMIKDKEAQLVTSILHKHASLYTLDEKNAIPKDPLHPPRNTVTIPPSVQHALAKESFPPRDTSVQVNETPPHTSKYTPRMPVNKKNMSPEIKETINALRIAQKPHLPGVQPKNQKSVMPSVTPRLAETEITSRLLVDTVTENDGSFKLSTQTITSTMPLTSKFPMELKDPKIIEYNEEEKVINNIYLQCKASPKSSNSEDLKESTSQLHEKNEKISSDDIGKCTELKSSSLESSIENYQQKIDSTIKPLSQNLKWKIIIKHHAEKPKPHSCINKELGKELQYSTRHCILENNLNFPG